MSVSGALAEWLTTIAAAVVEEVEIDADFIECFSNPNPSAAQQENDFCDLVCGKADKMPLPRAVQLQKLCDALDGNPELVHCASDGDYRYM